MARMAVGPGDVHTRATANVNLHAGRLASLVDRKWHFSLYRMSSLARRELSFLPSFLPVPVYFASSARASQQTPGGMGLP